MMSEMNKEKFEESWALPQLNNLCEITEDIDPEANPIGFLMATGGKNPALIFFAEGVRLMRSGALAGPAEQIDIQSVTKYSLFQIYGALERLTEAYSSRKNDDKLILKKLRDGEILKNDKRFNEYRTERKQVGIPIPVTEADNGWIKGTGTGFLVASPMRGGLGQCRQVVGTWMREQLEKRCRRVAVGKRKDTLLLCPPKRKGRAGTRLSRSRSAFFSKGLFASGESGLLTKGGRLKGVHSSLPTMRTIWSVMSMAVRFAIRRRQRRSSSLRSSTLLAASRKSSIRSSKRVTRRFSTRMENLIFASVSGKSDMLFPFARGKFGRRGLLRT
jgi:hypothetical protein